MADNTDNNTGEPNKQGKAKSMVSYSAISVAAAQQRLGFRIEDVKAVDFNTMSAHPYNVEEVDKVKERVYEWILQMLDIEGYPDESNTYYKEQNVNDLVLGIISPVLGFMRKETGRRLRLTREQEIISSDKESGGKEEFIVLDLVTVSEDKFVLIIEARRSSVGLAMKQILLSMKDAWDNNMRGDVYGLVTTGVHWRMVKYDGKLFVKTTILEVVFDTMAENQERWMKNCSAVVDCMLFALANGGGIVAKDVVV
ncbi:hypothetical protein DFH27DRAFT_538553 [Peziza echinospora]|nr:hypothetical protein DFH27DRAFT_538553 [Peziza echinospora]